MEILEVAKNLLEDKTCWNCYWCRHVIKVEPYYLCLFQFREEKFPEENTCEHWDYGNKHNR